MGVEHHASLPGEPKTNSLIERTNQIIVGGTTALLVCAGLPPCYWSYAALCFCGNYNIKGVSDEIPWSLYHGTEFLGDIISFGCVVYYKPPNTSSDLSGNGTPMLVKEFSQDTVCDQSTNGEKHTWYETLNPFEFPT